MRAFAEVVPSPQLQFSLRRDSDSEFDSSSGMESYPSSSSASTTIIQQSFSQPHSQPHTMSMQQPHIHTLGAISISRQCSSTRAVSIHTISQHTIRIQPAHNHAAARTLSSFEQLEKLQIRRAIKRICHSCTHSHNNNHAAARTLSLNVFECAVYLQLILYNQSHNTLSAQSVCRNQTVAINLLQSVSQSQSA